ncbi:MAG: alpha-glucuronidase family glycosyl hydrolase [Salinivirgaceae bacterium]|jgi:alpha-glucuronidase|nr:alpha-glucuronidase family glycosyl hydrolase [Salinivirgaceae bacterium]
MNKLRTLLTITLVLLLFLSKAENGYNLWLRYTKVENQVLLKTYQDATLNIVILDNSETSMVIKNELYLGLRSLLSTEPEIANTINDQTSLIIATLNSLPENIKANITIEDKTLGDEGYFIFTNQSENKKSIIITGNNDKGLLYGTFKFLSYLQQNQSIEDINFTSIPKIKHRLLNHWDNLDRTVERGYAGFSIFDWHKLPDYVDPRYVDYARANASIGINGTVVTNVNSNALILTPQYIKKLVTLANTFRPYGIKVYLTARFSAPVEIGGLKTADPTNNEVQNWWNNKAKEIYKLIPDFGGFLVKANSEGQPGPQDYKRTHAEGANMLADAVAPFGGIVMWRAFVYSHEAPDDRAKQAYSEFKPLDGKFRANVIIQVKNGAIDFQPREPFHPLFGATPKTPLMMEFQITQEYTGCATHLFYQAPLYKEVLNADTYAKGQGSTVAKIIDGSLHNNNISGIAGVANIGNDINWTGHPFAQANWYAFGRLAWNHELTAEEIAEEWLKMTFTNDKDFINAAKQIMINSRENLVNYMTPLGLHHIMARNHHYGPGPWVDGGRADWTSLYYHQANDDGIGFNRSSTGSNAISQYFPEVQDLYKNIKTCPENSLLWFHHVSWDKKLASGNSLWDKLCYKYYEGVDSVISAQKQWNKLEKYIDKERFDHVSSLLKIQVNEALWWRYACVLYFQQFSKQPIPKELEKPKFSLEHYKNIEHRFVPGIKNE